MNDAPTDSPTIRLYHYTTKRWALKLLWERRLKITEYAELNDPFELMPFDATRPRVRRFWAERIAALDEGEHGVICFSATWRNPRMWSHYAERHTGICLGFDVARSHAEPVRYIDRPLPDPFEHDRGATRRLRPEIVEAALRHKPAAWRDEEEWRVRAPLANRHDGVAYHAFDGGLDLREVILGARCTLAPEDVVEAVAAPPLDVEIFATRPAHGSFAIERHELVESRQIAGFRAELAQARDAYWHELGDEDGNAL